MILSKKITAILYILLATSVCEGMERTEQSPEDLNLLGNTHWNAYLANPTDPTANESLKKAIMCWEHSADFQPSREKLCDLRERADANIQYMLGKVSWDSFEHDSTLLDKKKTAISRWLLAESYGSARATKQIALLREKEDYVDYCLLGSAMWQIYESYPNTERANVYAIGSVRHLIESTVLMLRSKSTTDPFVFELINKNLESVLNQGKPDVLLGLADVFYEARFGKITMFDHGFRCLHALIKAKNADVDSKMIEIFSKFPEARVHFDKKMSEISKAQEHLDAEVLDPMTLPADGRSTTTTTTTTTPPAPSEAHKKYHTAMAAWENPRDSIALLIAAGNEGSEEAKAALDELRKSASYQVPHLAKKDSHGSVLRSMEPMPMELSANKLLEYAKNHWTTDTPEAVLYLLGAAKKGYSKANKQLETMRKSTTYREHLLEKNFKPTKTTSIEIVLKTMDFPGGVDYFQGEKRIMGVYDAPTPQQSVSPRANTRRGGSTKRGRKNNGPQSLQNKTPTNRTQGAVKNDSAAPSKTEQTHDVSPDELFKRAAACDQSGNHEESKQLLIAAAEQGHVNSMGSLGLIYTKEKNYTKAKKYYLQGLNLGNLYCMANYGAVLVLEGNFEEAEMHFKEAISRGHAPAIKNIASLYKEQNKIQEGKNYLATLIKEGHTNAAIELFKHFMTNLEDKEAEKIFLPLIEKRDTSTMIVLGVIYASENNYTEAKKYFFQALELGSTEAMRNYGEILGREGNFDGAEMYLKMAIEQGHVDAIENISILYKRQNKIQEGTNYLLTLIKEGNEKRNGTAIPMLFWHFMTNREVEEVEELLLPLVKEGNVLVMNNLGLLYMTLNNYNYKQAEKYFKLAIDNGCTLSQSNLNLMNSKFKQQETHSVEGKSGPEAKADEGEIPSQSREEGDAPGTLGADVSEEKNNAHQKRHRPGLERSKTVAHLPSLKDGGASSSPFGQPDSGKLKPKKTLPSRPLLQRAASSNHLERSKKTTTELPENSVGGKKTLKTRVLDFLTPTKYKSSPDNGKDKDKSPDKKTKSKKSDSTSVETRSSEDASGKASKKTLTRKKSSRSLKSTEEISPKAEMPAETLVSLKLLPELLNDYFPKHNKLLCEILSHKFELDPTNQETLSIILNRGGRKIDGGDIRKLFKELFKNTEMSEDSNAEMSEGEGSNTDMSEDSGQKDIRQTGGSHKVIKNAGLTLNPKAEGSKRKKGSYHGQLTNAKEKIIKRIVPKLTTADYDAVQDKE